MTQSTGFDAAGQGSSGIDRGTTTAGSAGGGFSGDQGLGQSGSGSSYNEGSSGGQGWMQQGFGGGQSGDMMSSIRDFSRNNRAATIGGGLLAILALARYASSSGKRRQEQRYRGSWQSTGRSHYGDDDRFRQEDYRGGRGYSRDSFSGSNRYTGGGSSWGGQSNSGQSYGGHSYGGQSHGGQGYGSQAYGGLRRAGRYGMKHPMSLTAGAALSALALSWLARARGQQGSHQGGGWQGSDQSFGGQDFQSSGGQGFQSGGGQGFSSGQSGTTGSSFSGGASGSSLGGGSSGSQNFGSGRMGSDAIEAAGSSSDIGQGTSGSSLGRGRTGTGSISGSGI